MEIPLTNIINFPLTMPKLIMLRDVLEDHNDEGPSGEGWQSQELINLVAYIKYTIKQASKNNED